MLSSEDKQKVAGMPEVLVTHGPQTLEDELYEILRSWFSVKWMCKDIPSK